MAKNLHEVHNFRIVGKQEVIRLFPISPSSARNPVFDRNLNE